METVSNMQLEKGRRAYEQTLQYLQSHHELFSGALPLIASENVQSPAVREALASDFGCRYAEGWPGERLYAGCKYIDATELLAISLAREVFNAEFADVRPISGVVANLVAYSAFAEPGDVMMALAIPHGGHISHGKKKWGGTAGVVRALDVERYEFNEEDFEIDIDETSKKCRELAREGKPPRLFLLGASVFLFPHPVRDIAGLASEYAGRVVYDGAHVAGLIAGKIFQDPLREGADAVTLSTHKTLAGPQHGMVLSWSKYEDLLKRTSFPGLLSNHHLHAVAGVAIALAEALVFYKDYARKIVSNAKALAQALYERGFDVLYERKDFTESHTLVADVRKFGNGRIVEEKLERANIIINRNLLPRDYKEKTDHRAPSGIRLGSQELTRLGMGESEMGHVAELIKHVVVDGEAPEAVATEVRELRREFQKVHYCFGSQTDAYAHIIIR